jgi:hypothetical protein
MLAGMVNVRSALAKLKTLQKSPIGIVGEILVIGTAAYRTVNLWSNVDFLIGKFKDILQFWQTGLGTVIAFALGFGLVLIALFRKSETTSSASDGKPIGRELTDSLGCPAPWVHEVEQFDREGIHNAVITERCEIIRSNYGYSPGDRPFVEFRCTVFNGSVFPIGTSESYEGSIRFQDQPLDELIRIGGMVVNLAHAHHGQFTIRQSLNRDEAETISRAGPDAQFQFDLLTIYVEPGNGITPQPLSLINVYKNGRPV